MENKRWNLFAVCLIMLTSIGVFSQAITEEGDMDTYIVFVQKPEGKVVMESIDLDGWYQSFLPVTTSSSDHMRMVYSYHNVVTGFAAKLTSEEAKAMEDKEGFVSARPQKVLALHTTHSVDFLGLHQNSGLWNSSNYGEGVIIGVLDTGITPNHPSFSDEGMPTPPTRWKGKCEFGVSMCNNKLIGARNFDSSSKTPLDDDGHGTHTSSTAGGNPVRGGNAYGQANGTAVGVAPLVHVAMYKVCGEEGCTESAILAAMDTAVEDGVDVLSLSLGGPSDVFYDDAIALGAYGAIQKGIFVSCSAGNSGPDNSSLSNEAPWILTVGASTIDRTIKATVLLGNNAELDGESVFQPEDFPSTLLPLVYAGANGNASAALCAPGSLTNVDVKGKLVLCERGGGIARIAKGQEVKDNGGTGMILMNDKPSGYVTIADAHVLPASEVSYVAGLAIKTYINSTKSPMATILFKGTVIGTPYAPQVASFSSRGPSLASPGILKPDVIGPGVSILAAWPTSLDNSTNPKSRFNVVSGTSMSCPHLSGIAALLKSSHPDWSPAAIKSAIMTTSYLYNLNGKPILDEELQPANVFGIGAGHVNPSQANDPGLVYDIQPDDYIPYLCGLGYSDREVGLIVQSKVKCSNVSSIPEAQLNYPSFAIKLGSSPQTYTRTATNVGHPDSSYTLQVFAPGGVDVRVTPDKLSFGAVNEKATYSVTFSRKVNYNGGSFDQGYLIWMTEKYSVRIPIAVMFE